MNLLKRSKWRPNFSEDLNSKEQEITVSGKERSDFSEAERFEYMGNIIIYSIYHIYSI